MTFPIQSKERSELEAEVMDIVRQLGPDELRVFRRLGTRLVTIGHRDYGPLDLNADRRNWKAEGADELADWLFYSACHDVATEDRRKERLRCFIHDAAFERVSEAMEPLKEVE